MASGHMNRVKRPDTWLHRPMLRNVKKVLANPKPSTHDPIETSAAFQRARCNYVLTDVVCEHFPLRNIVLHPTNAVQPV